MLRTKLAGVVGIAALVACRGARAPTAPDTTAPNAAAVQAITLTPNTWQLPPGGGSLEIIVATSANVAGTVVAPHGHVSLRASSGTLSADVVDTDSTGHARVTWSGTSSATVTAESADVRGTSTITVTTIAPPLPPPTPPSPSPPTPPGLPALQLRIVPLVAPIDTETIAAFGALAADSRGPVAAIVFRWDLDGDGQVDAEGERVTRQYVKPGEYTVRLHAFATDGRGGTATLRIGVTPVPFVVTLDSPTTAAPLAPIVLIATVPATSAPGPYAFTWDLLDDGDPEIVLRKSVAPRDRLDTVFTTAGTYAIRVTVASAEGQLTTAQVVITVR